MPLLFIFVLLPLTEIALFVLVGGWIGVWPTLGLVVAGVLAGVAVIRIQGGATLRQIRDPAATFADPAAPLAQAALVLAAGILLILPGFLTDVLALPLLIPPLRRFLLIRLGRRFQVRAAGFAAGPRHPPAAADVIDGEAVEITPGARPLPGQAPSGWTRPPQ